MWDKAARIEFIKPGKGTLTARFSINDRQIEDIIKNTAAGEKYLPEFSVDIMNESGETVTRVVKTIYIRKKLSNQH